MGMLAVYPLSSSQQQTLQQSLHHDNTSSNNNYDDDYSTTAYYDLDDLEYGNAFNNNSDDDDNDNNTKKKKKNESILTTHEYNKSISKYASIYIIFPKNTDQKKEEYTIGSKISKTRILSTNKWLMDNYIEGSIDNNILSASIFSYNDIQPGQIYTCIINK